MAGTELGADNRAAATTMHRRSVLLGAACVLAGCQARPSAIALAPAPPPIDPDLEASYASFVDGGYEIEGLDLSRINPSLLRRRVPDPTGERPGTLVVDAGRRRLYLVEDNGTALRYGIGVGREGLEWSGRAVIGRKAAWPSWRPTADMIRRDPSNAEWAEGMEGGLDNPLGARALYLYRDGRDTLYRLHGTNEPWSIGRAVSSGCIRLFNHDIVDLHARVPVGAPVLVTLGGRGGPGSAA